MHKSLFGIVVKKIRLEHGLTQESLASKSGLERTFISMLERGIKQPSLKTISSLAHAVGMKSYELLHKAEYAIHQVYSELTPYLEVSEDQRLFDALELERDSFRIGQIMNGIPLIFFARTPMPEYAATFVSKNINQLFGYDREKFMAHSGFWHAHIHENDLPHVIERLKTLDVNKTLNHEYRFLTESGNWLLVREELKLIVNEFGAPKEVIGSIVGVSMC